MRAMIVDDEAPARSELRYLLDETGRIESIMEASSAREAVEKLMEGKVDVLFLDISMPKTSGMQLAEALHRLKNPPAIVFVTAYSEYALEAFGVDAIDYLMKPAEPERLSQALDRVQARMKPQPQSHSSVERIPVVKSGRKVLVPIDQIRYIVSMPISRRPTSTKKTGARSPGPSCAGRVDWIRTSDPLTPSQVRYQTAPPPVCEVEL